MYTNIKGIFFDVGWTLETPSSGDWVITDRFRELCGNSTVDAAYSKLQKVITDISADYMEKNHLMSTLEQQESQMVYFYTLIAQAVPELSLSAVQIADIAKDRTYNRKNYILLPDTTSTLQELKHRGYKLGIISDTWPDIIPQLEYFDILKYFDCTTYSYQLGVFKPNPAMFNDALKKIALPPEQTVFDDDMAYILEGAQKRGINPIQSLVQPGKKGDSRFPSVKGPSGVLDLIG